MYLKNENVQILCCRSRVQKAPMMSFGPLAGLLSSYLLAFVVPVFSSAYFLCDDARVPPLQLEPGQDWKRHSDVSHAMYWGA
jgi:hypothetical protein